MSNADKVITESLVAHIEQLTAQLADVTRKMRELESAFCSAHRVINNNLPRLADAYQAEARRLLTRGH